MKTKPIGVRFDEEQLGKIMQAEGLGSPQQVVNFLLTRYFEPAVPAAVKVIEEAVRKNNLPENRARIMRAREGIDAVPAQQVVQPEECHHALWKPGDLKEGSMAFMHKYGCETYDELKGMHG